MPADAAAYPNVLLICTDHWSGALTRPAGHPVVMTPTIAQMARCGVTFTNAYSACPVCGPARRSLMTGLSTRGHGDRIFSGQPMLDSVTLPQAFRQAGYQTVAVGKLHVNPQRDRIGFDEVLLNEEGRCPRGQSDDYELYLSDHGFPGRQHATGMNNNDYLVRPWALPEHCHPTNWTAAQMCRMIHRRDPRKPGFWYLSFTAPHPPLWPLQAYLDLYDGVAIDEPVMGDWSADPANMPWPLRDRLEKYSICGATKAEITLARKAFYALVTHVDHQIRVVIGYLREQQLLDNTIIAFTSDHGDMLGDHGQWAKALFYDMSAKVPLLIVPKADDPRFKPGATDDRLAELRDAMPTLLDLAGVPIPAGEGLSLFGSKQRDYLYGEIDENSHATRMVRDQRFKLIYYPAGNRCQLFDIADDPRETRDLASNSAHADHLNRLRTILMAQMYGSDTAYIANDQLIGTPEPAATATPDRGLTGQRGVPFI